MCVHVRARLQLTEHMPRLNPPLESRGYCAFPPGVWVLEWVRPMAFHDDPRGGARVLLRWVSAPVLESTAWVGPRLQSLLAVWAW